ncbi:MAG: hypothetical protein J5857_11355 [Treponema sp.]|nr:hypothetical protein [Treponema sp.]
MNRSVLGKSKMTFTVFYKIILRVLSIAAIIVLLYGAVTNIICLKESIENRHDFFMRIFFIIANIITAAFFIFLFFKPEKLVPCSMVSIIYAIPNLIDNGSIGIGYFMLILFCLSLYIQGFF